MDNLIATTIAIALIAVVAAMGVNYGTDAVLNYQARVDASKIITDAQNIASAWKNYARANNGDPTLTDNCWGNSSDGSAGDLVPSYISTLPNPPADAVSTSLNYYFPALYKSFNINGSGTKIGPTKTPADSIALWLQNPRVCQQIVYLAGRYVAVPSSSLQMTSGGSNINLSALTSTQNGVATTGLSSPFDCVYRDVDSSGAPSQGDVMLFIYRVFDQNNFSTSSRSACP